MEWMAVMEVKPGTSEDIIALGSISNFARYNTRTADGSASSKETDDQVCGEYLYYLKPRTILHVRHTNTQKVPVAMI